MTGPSQLYVYYGLAGERDAALRIVARLLGDVESRTGITGRLLARCDDPQTWMEVYPDVADRSAFRAVLDECAFWRDERSATPDEETYRAITPGMATALGLSQPWGVIVSDTLPDGPAERAGLKPGDILTAVDGKPAENVPGVSYYFLLRDSGEKVHIEVLRGEEKLSFDVPVVEEQHDIDGVLALATPEKNLVPEIGILGVEINDRLAAMVTQLRHKYGIIVAARTSGSPRDVPLLPGDVILSMNTFPTMTLDMLRSALKKLAPADPIVLQIERDGKLQYLTFSLD